MQVIIVGHRKRIHHVNALLSALPNSCAVVDYDSRGAHWGHREALLIARMYEGRSIIMEDDAIPVQGFMDKAAEWIERWPNELISFYLGTGRPPEWQAWLDSAVKRGGDQKHIVLPTLIHGVCYTIPPRHIHRVITRLRPGPADFAVGEAWGAPVLYPIESLVEHRDETPVEVHLDGQPRIEVRKARFLSGPLMEI